MASFNISLSDELRKYVLSQVAGGDYGNVSEYFRSLIREHQKKTAQSKLELLLLAGVQSGDAGPMTASDWEELRQAALKRAMNRRKGERAHRPARKHNKPGTN